VTARPECIAEGLGRAFWNPNKGGKVQRSWDLQHGRLWMSRFELRGRAWQKTLRHGSPGLDVGGIEGSSHGKLAAEIAEKKRSAALRP